MARSAVARSQPWLASTRSETSGPTASRRRLTRSTSCATGCAAVLILKMRWPSATLARAFGSLRLRALDGERPGERHAVADAAAEQAVHGHAERLTVEVPERHLDGGAREGVTLNPPPHPAAPRLH